MTTLILTEKPDASVHIAEALSSGKPMKKISVDGVPLFEIAGEDGERILVCSALGHLYAVDSKDGGGRSHYPVWDFTWKPKYLVERGQKKQEKWIKSLGKVAKEADRFINSCDYDVEGSLIGYTILRYACNGADQKSHRMKFSTLTEKELREAYRNLSPQLDYPLVYAGLCRHEVDWLYGINLSRALTQSAYKFSNRYSTLSTGRVQGPTLRFIVEREREIETFLPEPFWMLRTIVDVDGQRLEAEYEIEKLNVKGKAEEIVRDCVGKIGALEKLESRTYRISPPTPFDLTGLQTEAYRHFGFTPRATLGMAERLYLDQLISYPRTSSQKLPPTIGYDQILKSLSSITTYRLEAEGLLAKTELTPNQGKKDDPAHPAVYPTGTIPKRTLDSREEKVFDLVVRGFLATFGEAAVKQSDKATIKVGAHSFYLRGSRILEKGWVSLYGSYAKFEEVMLPPLKENQPVPIIDVSLQEKYAQPPPRYNPSSLLKAMEDAGIGTKATRAEITETLYQRGYIKEERMVATPLAFRLIGLLNRHCPKVIDVQFTRELESHMEKIELGEATREQVLQETVEYLKPVIEELKSEEEQIGSELTVTIKSMKKAEITLSVPCPRCGQQLIVVRSRRTGKRFIGCSGKWTNDCSFSLPLPQSGTLTLLDKRCTQCGFQMIQTRRKGMRPLLSCPYCFVNKPKVAVEEVAVKTTIAPAK